MRLQRVVPVRVVEAAFCRTRRRTIRSAAKARSRGDAAGCRICTVRSRNDLQYRIRVQGENVDRAVVSLRDSENHVLRGCRSIFELRETPVKRQWLSLFVGE